MMYTRTRFTINPKGSYVECALSFQVDGFIEAAHMADCLYSGYYAGSGFRALTMTMTISPDHSTIFKMPYDIQRLSDHLKHYIKGGT